MISLTFGVVLIAVFGATEVTGHVHETVDWDTAIHKLLKKHLDDFKAKDVDALASEYEADGHRLTPGKPIAIGREAIADSYRETVVNNSLERMEMTALRLACSHGAVAEFSLEYGKAKGKGVMLVKMVNGVPKISTLVYNFDS